MIGLLKKNIGDWQISYISYVNQPLIIQEEVLGEIVNSVGNKDKRKKWKQNIAHKIFLKRVKKYDPNNIYAVSISMRFCGDLHGNLDLDIENYLKPIYDGLAAGLFSEESTNPLAFDDFQYDDSNFRRFYIERVSDAASAEKEGVLITVSCY